MPFTKAKNFLYSRTLFNMLFLNEVGPLGRWSQERCAIKINKKIDLANEDNCGPCGEYILTKLESVNKSVKNTNGPHLMAEHEELELIKTIDRF
uniref:Uncharacterized protein n=1 Tax=viral metagenome TaxID=1070528 RepID=A0A6C0CDV3_9ZZZZ